jgi:hypothetical protein
MDDEDLGFDEFLEPPDKLILVWRKELGKKRKVFHQDPAQQLVRKFQVLSIVNQGTAELSCFFIILKFAG